jgi:anti-anti-sigma factor
MQIEVDKVRGIVAKPDGLFDFSAGYDCVATIEAFLKDLGPTQVTIDFRQTTFMDSSGIGALISLMRNMPTNSPLIKLVHPSKSVYKLMEVCHLHRLFNIEVDQEA